MPDYYKKIEPHEAWIMEITVVPATKADPGVLTVNGTSAKGKDTGKKEDAKSKAPAANAGGGGGKGGKKGKR